MAITKTEQSARAIRAEAGFQVLACDISDQASVAALRDRCGRPAAIVHCASSGRAGPEAYRRVYYRGCRNLIAACQRSPLLFVSSTSVYGQTDGQLVTETSPAEPTTETGVILRQSKDLVLAARGIVVRLSGMYGPGRSVYLDRLLDGSARIDSGPSRFVNQIHRDDAVSAICLLLSQGEPAAGQIFNLSAGALSQRQLYEKLAGRLGRPVPPDAPPDYKRKRGWTNKQVDCEKLRALGWTPSRCI